MGSLRTIPTVEVWWCLFFKILGIIVQLGGIVLAGITITEALHIKEQPIILHSICEFLDWLYTVSVNAWRLFQVTFVHIRMLGVEGGNDGDQKLKFVNQLYEIK